MKFLSIFLAASALVSAGTLHTDVKLTNAGSPQVADSANILVGPYAVTFDGKDYAALCVDFKDQSFVGQTWDAYISKGSDGFANTYHPTVGTQYAEEMYLYSLITKAGVSSQERIDIQHAAWNLTDSGFTANAAAKTYVALAQANYASVNLANFAVLSSVCDNHAQEFVVQLSAAPEPGSYLLMGAGLLMVGFAVRARRQKLAGC